MKSLPEPDPQSTRTLTEIEQILKAWRKGFMLDTVALKKVEILLLEKAP